ncbi:MAG: helix-turn-helix domain-containing protein [Candidatus Moraniibacteriota bacterium]
MRRKELKMKDSDRDMREMISDHIQKERKNKGLSAETVANHLKISRSALTQIETGRNNVSAVMLWKLATLFGCNVGNFFPPTFSNQTLTESDIQKLESDRAAAFAKKCFPNIKNI